jgi:hypothetical protein
MVGTAIRSAFSSSIVFPECFNRSTTLPAARCSTGIRVPIPPDASWIELVLTFVDPESVLDGRPGSPFSNQSTTNPFATDAPRLYDQQGNYRGKLSANPYDPDSTSNPYGRYGSPFSPDSIKNPYGAGNPYSPSSPTNPYGRGLRIEGR